jgi:hypothetical protein
MREFFLAWPIRQTLSDESPSAPALAILTGVRQARPDSFPQNLSFELGEDREHVLSWLKTFE